MELQQNDRDGNGKMSAWKTYIYICTCIMEISRMDKILEIVNSRDKRESMAY